MQFKKKCAVSCFKKYPAVPHLKQTLVMLWCICFILVSLPAFLLLLSFSCLSHSTKQLPTTQLPKTPATHAQSHTCGAILKIPAHTLPRKRQQWLKRKQHLRVCVKIYRIRVNRYLVAITEWTPHIPDSWEHSKRAMGLGIIGCIYSGSNLDFSSLTNPLKQLTCFCVIRKKCTCLNLHHGLILLLKKKY